MYTPLGGAVAVSISSVLYNLLCVGLPFCMAHAWLILCSSFAVVPSVRVIQAEGGVYGGSL
jgi:hypothetical protein